MLRLAIGAPGTVIGQHREIIRDDQIVFLVCPWVALHEIMLAMARPLVTRESPLPLMPKDARTPTLSI
ncbi:hypothetical protein ROR02_30770 [Pararhodospirillum oryzae]|uniref:Uncharacterized protein n=1 Tax=Pararhodospirillum oryzae TaxID=478448 RepID=A0A512HBX0_9PROT|nr:hypothetical protein ROR02_30770 [Pararhodospirillum oryzae]